MGADNDRKLEYNSKKKRHLSSKLKVYLPIFQCSS